MGLTMKKKSDIRTSSINQMTGWLTKNIPDLIIKSDWTHQDFDIEGEVLMSPIRFNN